MSPVKLGWRKSITSSPCDMIGYLNKRQSWGTPIDPSRCNWVFNRKMGVARLKKKPF
ncbi:MAG: hypothetical protein BYD32DRAFT_410604, partial [Podila humilis]